MSPPSIPPPNRDAARPPRAAEAGVGRPGGLLVAALTAAIVFGIGQRLLPRHEPEAPVPAPTPTPPPPAPPPPPSAPTIVDAAVSAHADGPLPSATHADGTTADGQTDRGEPSDTTAARPGPAPARIEDAAEAAHPAATTRKPAGGGEDERPADKDLARAAWRRNRPDVSTDGNKVSLLIPLKGSIAGAGFRVTNRPHAVIVTLPKAASLITMRLYRVNRDGFRLLWINQAEKDADPKDGTSLKIGLGDLGDPLVEIKDDFVRVTMHRPTAGAATPEHAPAPAPKGAAAPEHATAPEPKGAAAAEHGPTPTPKGAAVPEHGPSLKGAAAPEHAPAAEHPLVPEHAPAPAPERAAAPVHPAAPEHAPPPKAPGPHPDAD